MQSWYYAVGSLVVGKVIVKEEGEKRIMGLLDNIKEEAKKSGQSKGKFLYFAEGAKKRIRFLTDLEDGLEIVFHDSYEQGINVPCQEQYGKACPYCEQEGLRTRNLYAWSVYDYESKDVKILMQAANSFTAVPAIMALYETYGTVLDRDFVISRTGKGQTTAYAVVPMDKNKFRNTKVKALSNKAILQALAKAYPADDVDSDDDFEDIKPKSKAKKSSKKQVEEELNYSEMTAKELYELCEEREIEAEPKMKAKYYIQLLEEYDEENESEDDDWDEDEGDKEEVDYSEMSAKELYELCKERKIDVLPKKSEKYYVKQLEEYDKAQDDWDDEDEDDEDEWED